MRRSELAARVPAPNRRGAERDRPLSELDVQIESLSPARSVFYLVGERHRESALRALKMVEHRDLIRIMVFIEDFRL